MVLMHRELLGPAAPGSQAIKPGSRGRLGSGGAAWRSPRRQRCSGKVLMAAGRSVLERRAGLKALLRVGSVVVEVVEGLLRTPGLSTLKDKAAQGKEGCLRKSCLLRAEVRLLLC